MTFLIIFLLVQAAQEPCRRNGRNKDPRGKNRHAGVRIVQHANRHQNQEGNAEVIRVRVQRRFEWMFCHDFRAPCFAEILLGPGQDKPGYHAGEYRRTIEIEKQFGIRNHVIQHDANSQYDDGNSDPVAGNAGRRQFGKDTRCLTILCQGIEHTARTVHTGIAAR